MTWPVLEIFGEKVEAQPKNFCRSVDGRIVLWQLPPSTAAELHKSVSIFDSSREKAVGYLLLLRGAQCISIEGLSTLLAQASIRTKTKSLSGWDTSG